MSYDVNILCSVRARKGASTTGTVTAFSGTVILERLFALSFG